MNAQLSPLAEQSKVEAARYALIRRLGFVFRHQLVGALQPLNMICHLMQRRLSVTPLDVASMRDSVNQVTRLVRTSIDASLDVVSWLTPDLHATIGIGEAIGECLSYLRSSLSFRGFVIRHEESKLTNPVSPIALREVLSAALLATADHAKGMNEIVVHVVAESNGVEIAIEIRPGLTASSAEHDAYRLIEWDDVQVLAASHGLDFSRLGDGLVKIRIAASEGQ